MIGPLEVVILIAIVLVVFAGYFRKHLPQIGRSAGRSARIGGEKAKELADTAGGKVGDKFDPAGIGRSAGKGVREAREIRDSFKGALDTPPKAEPKTAAAEPAPKAEPETSSPSTEPPD